MKEYDYKLKGREILINCIKLLSIFIIVQFVVILLAFKFYSNDLTMILISTMSINILAYYIVLK